MMHLGARYGTVSGIFLPLTIRLYRPVRSDRLARGKAEEQRRRDRVPGMSDGIGYWAAMLEGIDFRRGKEASYRATTGGSTLRERRRVNPVTAIVQGRYGSSDALALGEIDRPVPGDGGVLVRVRAASVHADVWHAMTGQP
jgi:hypothetical protein